MTQREAKTIVLADTSVLLNLAIVDRLDLLGALRDHRFRVPGEVVAEVRRPELRRRLKQALQEGHLTEIQLTGVALIDHYRRLHRGLALGPGESACLALAHQRRWIVASDERGLFRREARRLLGEGRLLNTPGLFLLAIRHDYWTASEADEAKDVLERNRFRMPIRSFDELMRRHQTGGCKP